MQELVRRLHEQGCEIWAVSSSNEWVIRAGMKQFGIAEDRILAAKVEVENGMVTDRLVRVPSGPGKPQGAARSGRERRSTRPSAIRAGIRTCWPIARHGFAVNPNPDLEEMARERGWTVYFPEGTR